MLSETDGLFVVVYFLWSYCCYYYCVCTPVPVWFCGCDDDVVMRTVDDWLHFYICILLPLQPWLPAE